MKRHVTFIAASLPKISHGGFRPLVRLGQQHPVAVFFIHVRAERFEERVRLRQIFAGRPLALVKIRHGVQPHSVHAQIQPEIHHLENHVVDFGIVEVQIRLVRKKAVPVISLGDRIHVQLEVSTSLKMM